MRDEADLHHLELVASTDRERDTGGSWRLPIGLTLLPCQQSSVHIAVPLLYITNRLDPCHHTFTNMILSLSSPAHWEKDTTCSRCGRVERD